MRLAAMAILLATTAAIAFLPSSPVRSESTLLLSGHTTPLADRAEIAPPRTPAGGPPRSHKSVAAPPGPIEPFTPPAPLPAPPGPLPAPFAPFGPPGLGTTIVGRILDPRSQPVADKDFHAVVEGENFRANATFETDGAGHFRCVIQLPSRPASLLRIGHGVAARDWRTITCGPPPVASDLEVTLPGELPEFYDVGAVRLGTGPTFVEGRVVDAQGQGMSATVNVDRLSGYRGPPTWSSCNTWTTTSDEDGRFRIIGEPVEGEFRVLVGGATPVRFVAGQVGVTVRVLGSGILRASFEIEGLPRARSGSIAPIPGFEIELEWDGAIIDCLPRHAPRSAADIEWVLPPGTYDLRVVTISGIEVLHATGIEVRPNATTREPRLTDVNLMLAVTPVRITVTDEAGKLLWPMLEFAGQPSGRGLRLDDGSWSVLVPPEGLTITVSSWDSTNGVHLGPVTLANVVHDREVRLAPAGAR
ncbi:MAG: carboxypeptidase regulatory-like domain-containing protein [bacterium]|nr:carboxypeptidase regulatory-like domain-containing protein [bacterium]